MNLIIKKLFSDIKRICLFQRCLIQLIVRSLAAVMQQKVLVTHIEVDLWISLAIREHSLGREASVGQMLFENELVKEIARNLPDVPRAYNMESKLVGSRLCALHCAVLRYFIFIFSDYFTNNYKVIRERHIDEKMSHGYYRITAAKIVDKYVLKIYVDVLLCCYHCVVKYLSCCHHHDVLYKEHSTTQFLFSNIMP